ncbi:ribonuclease H-like protein [Violaceomyces palustris]|uniref:Ribonuclease H-like protein n=1 Tax=Violaceomyces palustris TaxID=1673888 RepID=A0ACD0P3B1_9BASI|nr:ribonuclease H-like protein [Violaceomyces palustris]
MRKDPPESDPSSSTLSLEDRVPPPPIPSQPTGPILRSYTWSSPVPSHCKGDQRHEPVPCVLGVDEAGRGPVLGPLVYGVAYCPLKFQQEMKQIGFADSKALTAEKRDSLLEALIQRSDQLGWAIRALSPQDISSGMLRRRPNNLNAQSCQATVQLIANVLESGVDVTEIYVDTVGDAKSYSKLLSSHFPRHPHIKWTVTSKADAIYPIVGAASIAAKVTRDRCLENWIYAEKGLGRRSGEVRGTTTDGSENGVEKGKRSGEDRDEDGRGKDGKRLKKSRRKGEVEEAVVEERGGILQERDLNVADSESDRAVLDEEEDERWVTGSGYPGDPKTVEYLKRNLDPVFGWPGIVRFSWATAKTMLEEKTNNRQTTSSSSSYTTTTLPPSNTRAHKVTWIDQPVSISKFFGKPNPSNRKMAAASAPSSQRWNDRPSPQDLYQIAKLEILREEAQIDKREGTARVQSDLGLSSCGYGWI